MSLRQGLLLHCALGDGPGYRLDSHGGYHLLAHNCPAAELDPPGSCCRLVDSLEQYLDHPDHHALRLHQDQGFTVSMWVKLEEPMTGFPQLVNKDNIPAGEREWSLYAHGSDNSNRFALALFNGATLVGQVLSPEDSLIYGKRQHVLAWYNPIGLTANLMVDGGSVHSTTLSGVPAPSTSAIHVGAEPHQLAFTSGLFRDLSMWSRVLTANERSELFNQGEPLSYENYD